MHSKGMGEEIFLGETEKYVEFIIIYFFIFANILLQKVYIWIMAEF